MSRRRRWPATALALAAAVGGCAPRADAPERLPVFDLAAELATAETTAEVADLAVGTPAGRRYLGAGWAADETTPEGEPFVWSKGPSSVLLLPLVERRTVELALRCHPFRFPGAPRQAVDVVLGGRSVARLELASGLRDYAVELPAARLRAGVNVVELRYRYHRVPRELGLSRDRRSLAIALHGARVADAPERPPTLPTAEGTRLFIPWRGQVDYFLPLPAASVLGAEAVRARRGDGHLEVRLRREAGEDVVLGTLGGTGDGAVEVALGERPGLARPGLARLRLVARATDDAALADPGGGMLLQAPRILAPAAVPRRGAPPARVAATAPVTASATRPDVVLYLVDTLRADHVGAYGDDRGLTPRIDAFAGEAALFERVLAQSSWTRPAAASLLTGHWPLVHGVVDRRDRLSDAAHTLPEILRAAGYRTVAVFANVNVTAAFGFAQGFDHVVYHPDLPRSEVLAAEADRWLAAAGDGPVFLFVHTIDPHAPYAAPAELRARHAAGVRPAVAAETLDLLGELQTGERRPDPRLTAELAALYAAEVAANDRGFGALLDVLRRRGRYDDAAIVLTSDHGEEFADHGGFQHARTLHSESVNVPLLVKPPRRAGIAVPRRLPRWVQHADLLPTLLELAGLPVPVDGDGASLLPRLRAPAGAAAPPPEDGFADRPLFAHLALGADEVALVDGPWKAIFRLARRGPVEGRLYHQPSDPGERRDLAAERPVRTGFYATALRRKLAEPRERLTAPAATIDAELAAELRALGYIR